MGVVVNRRINKIMLRNKRKKEHYQIVIASTLGGCIVTSWLLRSSSGAKDQSVCGVCVRDIYIYIYSLESVKSTLSLLMEPYT